MALIAEHPELLEAECNAYALTDRHDDLEAQAEELTAQAKGIRVLDWTVRSLVDPHSLVH